MQDEHTTDRPDTLVPRLQLERPEQVADPPVADDPIDDGTGDQREDERDDRDPSTDAVE